MEEEPDRSDLFRSACRAVRNHTPLGGRKVSHGVLRMKRFGKVDIPSEAFTVLLKRD
jgi:hypothetical protein